MRLRRNISFFPIKALFISKRICSNNIWHMPIKIVLLPRKIYSSNDVRVLSWVNTIQQKWYIAGYVLLVLIKMYVFVHCVWLNHVLWYKTIELFNQNMSFNTITDYDWLLHSHHKPAWHILLSWPTTIPWSSWVSGSWWWDSWIGFQPNLSCLSTTVLNMSPNEHKSTIRVGSSDHSWSFVVIRAMTMTMTIYSNSVLLVHVDSTKFMNMPVWISFIRGDTHGERVVIVFVAQLMCCIPVDLHCTLRHSCKYISHEWSANVTR